MERYPIIISKSRTEVRYASCIAKEVLRVRNKRVRNNMLLNVNVFIEEVIRVLDLNSHQGASIKGILCNLKKAHGTIEDITLPQCSHHL
jgi:hypothetical protein